MCTTKRATIHHFKQSTLRPSFVLFAQTDNKLNGIKPNPSKAGRSKNPNA